MKSLQSGIYFDRACTTAITETSRLAHSCHGSCTQAVMPSVVLALVAWESLCFSAAVRKRLEGFYGTCGFLRQQCRNNGFEVRNSHDFSFKLCAFYSPDCPTLHFWFAPFVSECMSQIQPDVLQATKHQCAPAAARSSVLRTRLELSWSKTHDSHGVAAVLSTNAFVMVAICSRIIWCSCCTTSLQV